MITSSSAEGAVEKLYYVAYRHTVNIRAEIWTQICLMPSLYPETGLLLVRGHITKTRVLQFLENYFFD